MPDREQLREWGRRGGIASGRTRAAQASGTVQPYTGTFLDFLDATGRGGPTRTVWRSFWKVADGLALEPDELEVFRRHTHRQTAPTAPARECWVPAGRRGGKSEQMVTRATWRAIGHNWRDLLSPGEVGLIPIISPDRDQGRNSLSYLKALARAPLVAPFVSRILRDSVEFRTGAVVKVATASWRSTRGFTMLDVLLEECAFYRSEESANPDEEILNAVRPALLTVPGARVYGISSPYAQKGILWKAYEQHWGRDCSDVLVFSADSLSLNPTLNPAAIEREFADDPARAASEYGQDGLVSFRTDVEQLFAPTVVRAVVVVGRTELAPERGTRYFGFVDPSGGAQDSFSLGIAHCPAASLPPDVDLRRLGSPQRHYLLKSLREQRGLGTVILDLVREIRPPFSPDAAVREFAAVLKSYRISVVTGDRFGGEWVVERFRAHGLRFSHSERPKSTLYGELLPLVNSGRVELLDLPRLVAQLCGLERHVGRSGKDSIDHPHGVQYHDDLANAAAGALVLASESGGKLSLASQFLLAGPLQWS